MKNDLQEKIFLITGGARGIGKSLVSEAAKKGARVIFCDINDENAKNVIDINQKSGFEVDYYHCDVSNYKSVESMFEKIKEKYGKIDVLINNAATQTVNTWDEMEPDEFSWVIDTNLKGVYYCMRYGSQMMQEKSTIVNILSIYYNKPRLDKYHYDASKGGVAQLTKEGALTLAERGISVNAVYPGYVSTPLNSHDDKQLMLKKNLLKDPRISEPEYFAKSVMAFIENFSLMTTGQLFGVDAGRGLR